MGEGSVIRMISPGNWEQHHGYRNLKLLAPGAKRETSDFLDVIGCVTATLDFDHRVFHSHSSMNSSRI